MEPTSLAALRLKIDDIDESLIELIASRFRTTDAVGRMKAMFKLGAVDPDREAKQAERYRSLAETHSLNPVLVESIFRLVIEEVVRNHRKVANEADK